MSTLLSTTAAIVELARPKQWVKNLFVFAPLIFAKEWSNPDACMMSFLAFTLFCLFSSCVYMMNDVADLERDRQHPEKQLRPLPSGRLGKQTAVIVLIIVFSLAATGSYWLPREFIMTVFVYFGLNILYSFYCKSLVILDGMIIASGFVLRTYAGAVVIGREFSDWLYICAIFVSLFLAFSKRRHEIILLGDEKARGHREILQEYSIPLLDQIISIVTAATLVTYSLYCIDYSHLSFAVGAESGSPAMKFTIPFVIYGLFRYLYLVYHKEEGGNPTELLLNDKPLIINGVLWLVVVFWALSR